jgi:hypothetical protein
MEYGIEPDIYVEQKRNTSLTDIDETIIKAIQLLDSINNK